MENSSPPFQIYTPYVIWKHKAKNGPPRRRHVVRPQSKHDKENQLLAWNTPAYYFEFSMYIWYKGGPW